MQTMLRNTLIPLTALAFSVPGATSQTLQGQSVNSHGVTQTGNVIRTTTRLVQVSVVVTDKEGQPVTGLNKESFTILDGGHQQEIAMFAAETPSSSDKPVRTLPPNIFTNRHDVLGEAPGSNTVIFLDALNTSQADQAHVREQVLRFLKGIRPQDHFAIYALTAPTQVQILHEFTRDDAALVKAIEEYSIKPPDRSIVRFANALDFTELPTAILPMVPQDTMNPKTAEQSEELRDEYARMRTYPLVGAMIGIANHVAAIPGRKNLIWITGGTPLRLGHLPDKVRLSELGYRLRTPEYADTGYELMRAVAESCNAANVGMYGVDVHGVQVDARYDPGNRGNAGDPGTALQMAQKQLAAEQDVRDTYRMLADETGGTAFYGNNQVVEGMIRAFDDGRYAYTIGYYPDHIKWDGSFRKIQIKIKEEGDRARYRDGYYATPGDPSNLGDAEKQLKEAADSPLDSNSLSMMVSGQHMQQPSATSRELKFQVGVDVAQLHMENIKSHRTSAIDLVFVQRNDKTDVIAADKKHIGLDFTEEQYQGLLNTGAIFEWHLQLLPEAKDVRVIVRDTGSGQIGTVTVPVKTFFPATATR